MGKGKRCVQGFMSAWPLRRARAGSTKSRRPSGMLLIKTGPMSFVNVVERFLYVCQERLIVPEEVGTLSGDRRTSSRAAACMPLKKGETKSLLDETDGKPCLPVGHLHFQGCLAEGTHLFHQLQEPEGAIAKRLALSVKPHFVYKSRLFHVILFTLPREICQESYVRKSGGSVYPWGAQARRFRLMCRHKAVDISLTLRRYSYWYDPASGVWRSLPIVDDREFTCENG
jgi:hypothetical protein